MALAVYISWDYICDPRIRFEGNIIYTDGSGVAGANVQIKKKALGIWWSIGKDTTDSSGHYNIPSKKKYRWVVYRDDVYRLFIDGKQVDERTIVGNAGNGGDWTWEGGYRWKSKWAYTWDYTIPEFATIAIPAIAVLGLFLFFNKRKRRKD